MGNAADCGDLATKRPRRINVSTLQSNVLNGVDSFRFADKIYFMVMYYLVLLLYVNCVRIRDENTRFLSTVVGEITNSSCR